MHEVPRKEFKLSIPDRVIASAFPGWANARLKARSEMEARRAILSYAHAYPSLDRPQTSNPLTSEEAQLQGYSRFQIIDECKTQYRENPVVKALVDGIARRAIGTGINLSLHTDDEDWNKQTTTAWNDWCDNCETRGLFDIHDCQEQWIRSCFTDGDSGTKLCSVLIDPTDPEAGDDLKLELIEGDRIAEDYRVSINLDRAIAEDYQHPSGQTIPCWKIGGLLIAQSDGRPVAYYVGQRGAGGLLQDSTLVPAEVFLLMYRQQRVDQWRGVPLLYSVLPICKDLNSYLNATRIQANIAATYGVVVTRNAAAQFAQLESQAVQNQNYRTLPLSTGKMVFLNPGEDIRMFNPGDVPAPQFDQYAKFLVRLIAIGCGTTYEQLMQDFTGMSFSSSKANMRDVNLANREWQRWVVRKAMRRIYSVWVSKRMENGLLPENDQALSHFGFRGTADLGADPVANASASVELLKGSMTTLKDWYLENEGADYEPKVLQRIKEIAFIKRESAKEGVDPVEVHSILPPGVQQPKENSFEGPVRNNGRNGNHEEEE